MSRMGKQPIECDDRVKVEVADNQIIVTGPKGSLTQVIPDFISVRQEEKKLIVECNPEFSRAKDVREAKAKHGLCRSLLQGMVTGVSTGFRRQLEIQGVGYRGQCAGQHLTLTLGYSHSVEYDVSEGVEVTMPKPTIIVLESIDKQLVGQTAATIRGFRPPDAYKGKGIRYAGEQISLKEGKTVG